ncbi:hypothetical protein Tsubulata_046239, partial [Turnera subulata]
MLRLGMWGEAKCIYSRMLERNVISSNSMIVLFGKKGSVLEACRLFNECSLIHMYSTCGDLVAAQSLFNGGCSSDVISWNSMISFSGYLKYGKVERARDLFDPMPKRDVVSWSTMVSSYSQRDRFAKALELFREMKISGFAPDETTLVSVISACTYLAALDQGKWIHTYITKNGLKFDVFLGTALTEMYMKFGFIENAMEIFQSMEDKGLPTLNVVISGLAMNGLVAKSLDMFQKMKERGLFDSMIHEYKVEPNVKHYGCVVDLLARAGMLREAEELIYSVPMAPDISASKGNWDDVHEIWGKMMQHGTPDCRLMVVNGTVREFLVGDKTHSRVENIEDMLDELETRNGRKERNCSSAMKPPTPVRIMKNWHIYTDCKTAAKLVSKAFNWELLRGIDIAFITLSGVLARVYIIGSRIEYKLRNSEL